MALTRKLILHIVHSITRGGVALVVASGFKFLAEDLIVLLRRHVFEDDLLLIFGDLEDDELRLVGLGSASHAEFVEG